MLGASNVLRRLRDRVLLELHAAGSASFYELGPSVRSAPAGGEADGLGPLDRGELDANRGRSARIGGASARIGGGSARIGAGLMIDRIDKNGAIVGKFLDDDAFKAVVTEHIARKIYEGIKKTA